MRVQTEAEFPISTGDTLLFDYFAPAEPGNYPLVVMIHGGGWVSGDRTMFQDEAAWLAPQGYCCACISYRLAPLYPFPAAVADVQAFVRWARTHSEELGFDPERVVALGNSAGGHLSLMLGLCHTVFDGGEQDGSYRANAVIDICGIADFRDPQTSHFPISYSFLEQFLPDIHNTDCPDLNAASPVSYATPDSPPCLIVHGVEDDVVPVDQSRKLASALGPKGTLVELPGESHSFSYHAWDRIRAAYTKFLKEAF